MLEISNLHKGLIESTVLIDGSQVTPELITYSTSDLSLATIEESPEGFWFVTADSVSGSVQIIAQYIIQGISFTHEEPVNIIQGIQPSITVGFSQIVPK